MNVINLRKRIDRLDPDNGTEAKVYFIESESQAPTEYRRGVDTVWPHGNWNSDKSLAMPKAEFQKRLRKLMKEINGKTRSVNV